MLLLGGCISNGDYGINHRHGHGQTKRRAKRQDKATEILDMISFTKENGQDIILIKVGDNLEIKIKK